VPALPEKTREAILNQQQKKTTKMGRIFNQTSETTGATPNTENREVRAVEFQGKLNVYVGPVYIGDAADQVQASQMAEEWKEKYPERKWEKK
jgi:tRNA G26 N,N-dimethylase Trm1